MQLVAVSLWVFGRFLEQTVDVDMNVFIKSDDETSTTKLLDALESHGAEYLDSHVGKALSRLDATKLMKQEDHLYIKTSGRHVDVFLSKTIIDDKSRLRRMLVTIGDDEVYFLDPETLAAYKLMQHSNKDIVDLEHLFSVRGDKLDINYIKKLLGLCLNEDGLAFTLLAEMENKFVTFDKVDRLK